MLLEIVSPEAVLFKGDVESVAVPGVNGEFQMLNNHAPVVSLLQKGDIKIYGNVQVSEVNKSKFKKGDNGLTLLPIESGTIELKDNKIIILAD
ncbi:MAG: F0F1 ATP synthase subunit epsilon [Aureibaculum sp.]